MIIFGDFRDKFTLLALLRTLVRVGARKANFSSNLAKVVLKTKQ